MRCMLVEHGDRLVLIDTGMGDKQSEKFFGYYYLFGDDSLKKSIRAAGFDTADITDVVLTHLHFDHCGGAIDFNRSKEIYAPAFPNAVYWSSRPHWNWAVNPNPREKASFLAENIRPIEESGQLKFAEREGRFSKGEILPGFRFFFADGHTESQMIPMISYKGRTLVFCADLLPSTGHIPLPYVMGYDVRPLETLKEKELFLRTAAEEEYILFLEHDITSECCTVKMTEKGVRLNETFSFSEV